MFNHINYYNILDVPETASDEEIKTAYRKLLRQTHPDVGGNERLFRLVQDAWNVLGNADTKFEYDQNLNKETYTVQENNELPKNDNKPSDSNLEQQFAHYYEYSKRREYEEAYENEQKQQEIERITELWSKLPKKYYKAPNYNTAKQWVKLDRFFTGITVTLSIIAILIAGKINYDNLYTTSGITEVIIETLINVGIPLIIFFCVSQIFLSIYGTIKYKEKKQKKFNK